MTRPLVRAIMTLGIGFAQALLLLDNVSAQPTLEHLENEAGKAAPQDSQQQRRTEIAPAEPGYLGLVADDQDTAGRGVRVMDVIPASPAAQAGILVGDLIVGIEGRPITRLDEMAAIVADNPAGTRIDVSLQRNGQPHQATVHLGSRPQQRSADTENTVPGNRPDSPALLPRRRLLGIRTAAVTEEIRRLYNLPTAQGALVAEVLAGSPAHKAGVPLDAVIVEANAKPIHTPMDLAAAVASVGPGNEIELGYLSRGQLIRQKVRLEDDLDEPQVANRPARPPAEKVEEQDSVNLARLEQLERRIAEMEAQVRELLKLLKHGKEASDETAPPSDESPK